MAAEGRLQLHNQDRNKTKGFVNPIKRKYTWKINTELVYLRNDSSLNKKEENKKKISLNSLLVYSVFESVFEELFTL